MSHETRSRAALGWLLPWAVLLVAMWPLISARETLYDRDFLNYHYQARYALAESLSEGRIPLVDPLRGGQPLAGNPNAVALYPTNLLLPLGADPLWVLNLQFWLHLLLAPFAMAWLGRALGLDRRAAWVAGILYATSGWAFSLSNLQNLSAGLALIPAFAAAVVRAWNGRAGALVAAGVLWALLILAGDPMSALLAGAIALSAAVAHHRARPDRPIALVLAVAAGTLVAAPQILTFLQILPGSYREYWGYSESEVLATSWNPVTSIEWLLPFFFGIADEFSFWGGAYYRIDPPFFYSLYPGLLAFALLACAGRPRTPLGWWAWGCLGAGLFMALGSANPVAAALIRWTGSTIRFPIKLWPLVTIGVALLGASGYARTVAAGRPRPLLRALAAFALLYAVAASLTLDPSAGFRAWVERITPGRLSGAMLDAELGRWSVLSVLTLALLGLLVGAAWLARRRAALAGAVLLVLHAGSQALLLVPAYDSDSFAVFTKPPALRGLVGEPTGWLVHARNYGLFGPSPARPLPAWEDLRKYRFERARYAALYPHAGLRSGLGYEFDPAPEGLDAFLSVALAQAFGELDDEDRVRLLATSGVEVVISDAPLGDAAEGPDRAPPGDDAVPRLARPLDAAPGAEAARPAPVSAEPAPPGAASTLLGRGLAAGVPLFAYHLDEIAPPIGLFTDIRYAPDLNRSLKRMLEDDFDPRSSVLLPGEAADRRLAPGSVRVVADRVETIELEVDAPEGGVVLVQRAFLPLYRAAIDGVPVRPHAGNIHRVAVEVPPRRHQVRIWTDRGPLRAGFALSALGGLVLLVLARRRPEGPELRPASGG